MRVTIRRGGDGVVFGLLALRPIDRTDRVQLVPVADTRQQLVLESTRTPCSPLA